jgi:hypothetical protein
MRRDSGRNSPADNGAVTDMNAQRLIFTLASGAFLVIVVLVVSNFSRRALTLANRRKELERLKADEADSGNDH